jgi:hypothetical protein
LRRKYFPNQISKSTGFSVVSFFFQFFFKQIGQRRKKKKGTKQVVCRVSYVILLSNSVGNPGEKQRKNKPKRQDDGFQNIFQTDKGATAANIYIQKRSNQEELDIYNPRPQSSTHTWLRVFYLFDCFVNLSLCSSKAITVSVSR